MKLPITLPFDKFVILSETMFESNPNIVIQCLLYDNHNDEHIPTTIKDTYTLSYIYGHKFITITSIEVRLPKFSVGDTVMIVDTGEIGKVYEEDTIKMEAINESNNMFFVGSHNENEFYGYFHPSQLVKIPTDLIKLLESE